MRFHCIGADPPPAIRALGSEPGIVVHGHVPDLVPYMERVRVAVERHHGWGSAPVTLSLGVAAMLAAPGGDATQLRARAEHALQLAQRQGRNRVAAFSGW